MAALSVGDSAPVHFTPLSFRAACSRGSRRKRVEESAGRSLVRVLQLQIPRLRRRIRQRILRLCSGLQSEDQTGFSRAMAHATHRRLS